jgi:Na+/H+ antiporter NhaC
MSRIIRLVFLFLFYCLIIDSLAFTGSSQAENKPAPSRQFLDIELPRIIVQHVEARLYLSVQSNDPVFTAGETVEVMINGTPSMLTFHQNKASFPYTFKGKEKISVEISAMKAEKHVRPIPLWMSVLPPLLAIAMALIFREVISALFVGLLTGTFIIWFFRDAGIVSAFLNGLLMIIDTYIPAAIMDRGHVSIIIFSMLIGAMVNLITRNGGMKGVVNILSRFASTPRSGQFATWFMGMAIFFDDYANTLVVGNTMQPVTDRLRTSREKLAYIVDSTAAPIAAIAFVTTWIGAQLSYIADGIRTLELNETPYQVFIYSLQYAFYPILTLAFVGMLIYMQRDFGPMLRAEIKARRQEPPGAAMESNTTDEPGRPRWFNAAIPVFIVVAGTITGLIITGLEAVSWDSSLGLSRNLSNIIGQADTYRALLWSSLAATLVALLLTVSQKLLSLKDSIESLIDGFKTMLTAIVILIMAWSIALITQDLHTADFISHLLLNLRVSPYMIPAITFLFAAGVAFSTGSSWGTMAILYPLILPASWMISQANQMEYAESLSIFHNVVSCVLAGSVLGDHISPISDTTILSSLASGCNHIEHVRTQLPYALAVGVAGIALGTIPAAYGIPFYITYPIALLVLFSIILLFGKKLTHQ